ncbi:iron-containing alcohol dehydrogenase [Psychrilyobacter sp.]|uniref:iron-containing alcohol dehydrogenase n=1 Tax=Psychrilyobacter sp. TaxID=2586924 RepID=UPI00301A5C28
MKENFNFTNYFVDTKIWVILKEEIKEFNNILIITGEKSFDAIKENLLPVIKNKNYTIKKYMGECSYEHSQDIIDSTFTENFDLVIAAGGGKAIDIGKIVASKINLDLFAIPTIASTCAGTSAVSVVYSNDHSFKDLYFLKTVPNKIFIDLETLNNAPKKYLWAGIGDTLGKYYEVNLKKENLSKKNPKINFSSLMGIELANNCKNIILENSEEAYFNSKITEEFKEVVLTIVVNTGMVSNLVDEFFNGAIAHSVFYGLTILPNVEKDHLHGEIVAFGILVQLLIEKKYEEYNLLLKFYEKFKLPISLKEIVLLDNFLEKENEILESILNSPNIVDFEFNINKINLKNALLYK